MKKLITTLFLCFCIFQINAQQKADYENAIGKFMKFYNNNQADSISDMFSDSWGDTKKNLWRLKEVKEMKKEYGNIKSYKYIGMEPSDSVILFKTEFVKLKRAIGLTLDKKNKLLTFRFDTSSRYIDSLLLKN